MVVVEKFNHHCSHVNEIVRYNWILCSPLASNKRRNLKSEQFSFITFPFNIITTVRLLVFRIGILHMNHMTGFSYLAFLETKVEFPSKTFLLHISSENRVSLPIPIFFCFCSFYGGPRRWSFGYLLAVGTPTTPRLGPWWIDGQACSTCGSCTGATCTRRHLWPNTVFGIRGVSQRRAKVVGFTSPSSFSSSSSSSSGLTRRVYDSVPMLRSDDLISGLPPTVRTPENGRFPCLSIFLLFFQRSCTSAWERPRI